MGARAGREEGGFFSFQSIIRRGFPSIGRWARVGVSAWVSAVVASGRVWGGEGELRNFPQFRRGFVIVRIV